GNPHLEVNLELPSKNNMEPAGRVRIVIRAGKRLLQFVNGLLDKLKQVIVAALSKSKPDKEFHARFREEFLKTFKEELKGKGGLKEKDFGDLRIETQYLLQTQDQYLSRGTRYGRRTRANG